MFLIPFIRKTCAPFKFTAILTPTAFQPGEYSQESVGPLQHASRKSKHSAYAHLRSVARATCFRIITDVFIASCLPDALIVSAFREAQCLGCRFRGLKVPGSTPGTSLNTFFPWGFEVFWCHGQSRHKQRCY